MQQQTLGNPLSESIICEKAKIFADRFEGLTSFKERNRCLNNFKTRSQNLSEISVNYLSIKNLSEDSTEAENLTEKFKTVTQSMASILYNTDETESYLEGYV